MIKTIVALSLILSAALAGCGSDPDPCDKQCENAKDLNQCLMTCAAQQAKSEH